MKEQKNFTGKDNIIEIVIVVPAWVIALAILYYAFFKFTF